MKSVKMTEELKLSQCLSAGKETHRALHLNAVMPQRKDAMGRSTAGMRSDKLLAGEDYEQRLQSQDNGKLCMKTESTCWTTRQVFNSLASLICKEEDTATLKFWVVQYHAVLYTQGYAHTEKKHGVKGNKGRMLLGRKMLGLGFHYLGQELRTVWRMIWGVTHTGSWVQREKGKLSEQLL